MTRTDPFAELYRLQADLARLMEGLPGTSRIDASRGTSWTPPVDVFEDAERLLFKIDLPEIRKEDIALRIDNNVLTIEGSRKLEFDDRQQAYHRVERPYGRFARSFSLPSTVATDEIKADLSNGVLRVMLLKKREAQPRSIPIQST